MCIFSQPVDSVSQTNIFARLHRDGWQSLVYQMRYETQQLNAMILPLPIELPASEDKSLEFISLEEHPRFFPELAKGFPLERPKSHSRSVDSKAQPPANSLVVHDVGDFVASFVPSIPDFDRLDARFRISKDAWDQIPQYADYGFAVFQLKSLKGRPHPMAFRFRSRLNTATQPAIFFPTVHIHDGEVHDREAFDHTLYLQSKAFDDACEDYQLGPRLVADRHTGYVRSKWKADEFCDVDACQGIIDGSGLIHRTQLRGTLKNEDVVVDAHPTRPQSQSGIAPAQHFSWLAASCLVGGTAWLIDRRNQLHDKK